MPKNSTFSSPAELMERKKQSRAAPGDSGVTHLAAGPGVRGSRALSEGESGLELTCISHDLKSYKIVCIFTYREKNYLVSSF